MLSLPRAVVSIQGVRARSDSENAVGDRGAAERDPARVHIQRHVGASRAMPFSGRGGEDGGLHAVCVIS